MSRSDIWFPFYIGDYLADTMHLTDAEHGRYLLLLLAYYKNRGPLPDDNEQLASTCKVTLSVWLACRSKLAKFFKIHDSVWHHPRADREIERSKAMQAARIKGAKATNAKLGRGSLSDTVTDTLSDTLSVVQSQSQSHKEGGGKQTPHSFGSNGAEISRSESITLENGVKRAEKRLENLRAQYEGEKRPPKVVEEFKILNDYVRTARAQLKWPA